MYVVSFGVDLWQAGWWAMDIFVSIKYKVSGNNVFGGIWVGSLCFFSPKDVKGCIIHQTGCFFIVLLRVIQLCYMCTKTQAVFLKCQWTKHPLNRILMERDAKYLIKNLRHPNYSQNRDIPPELINLIDQAWFSEMRTDPTMQTKKQWKNLENFFRKVKFKF